MGLTQKQEIFAKEYAVSHNALNALSKAKIYNELNTPKNYYVYFLIDPRNKEIFYIGKGKNKRVLSHLSAFKNGKTKNSNKYDRIYEILKSGHDLIHFIFSNDMTEEKALSLESLLIKKYKSHLVNGLSGIVSQSKKDVVWAKKLLSKSLRLEDYILLRNPSLDHLIMYQEIHAQLQRIAKGKEEIVRGIRISNINGSQIVKYL